MRMLRWLTFWAVLLVPISAGLADSLPLQASLVTIKGEVRLRDALKELAATGNRVIDLRPRLGQEVTDPLLKLHLDRVPFWQAADAIADQAGLRLTPHMDRPSGEPALGIQQAISDSAHHRQPRAYSGPFRAVVRQVTASRDLLHPDAGKLTIQLELAAEPRLTPLLLRQHGQSANAKLTGDGPAIPAQTGSGMIKWLGEAAIDYSVQLPLPPRTQQALPELAVDLKVLTPPKWLDATLPALSIGSSAGEQGVEVKVSSFRIDRPANQWQVGLTLGYPSGTMNLESHQTWAFERNRIELQHKQTQAVLRSSFGPEIGIDEGRSVHIAYRFTDVPGKPEDWRIVYRAPAPPVVFPLQVAFKDLPLP